jgi:Bacterial Ig-like domain (group 3)
MPPATTATSLSTYPASPVAHGIPVTLTATVTPAAAAGTVQFRNEGINLGDPVIVTNGTAMGDPLILPPGIHQLTATFNPTDPGAFTTSTAPVVLFEITDRS